MSDYLYGTDVLAGSPVGEPAMQGPYWTSVWAGLTVLAIAKVIGLT